MKLNTGMRCHDLCEKMEMEKVFQLAKENGVHQIQLAFAKSISNYDFTTLDLPATLKNSWIKTRSMWLFSAAILTLLTL